MEVTCRQGGLYACEGRQCVGFETTGVGVPGGAEAAVRAARRYLDNMQRGQVFIKIDFRNAFNTLSRGCHYGSDCQAFSRAATVRHVNHEHSPSDLQFGEFVMLSEEGAEQGDPPGPLYFCLVFNDLLESLLSELVLGYLDDVAVGDTAEIVLKDFIVLESTAARLGIKVKRLKCELLDTPRRLGTSHDAEFLETTVSGFCIRR